MTSEICFKSRIFPSTFHSKLVTKKSCFIDFFNYRTTEPADQPIPYCAGKTLQLSQRSNQIIEPDPFLFQPYPLTQAAAAQIVVERHFLTGQPRQLHSLG